MPTTKPWPDHLEIPDSWKKKTDAEIADRYGDIDNLFALLGPLFTERAQLRKLIDAKFEKLPGKEEAHLDGKRWRIKLSVCEHRRRIIDKLRLKRMLAARGLFDKAWTVTMEFIDRYLPEDKHELFLVTEQCGPRNLSRVSLEELKHLGDDPAVVAARTMAGLPCAEPEVASRRR